MPEALNEAYIVDFGKYRRSMQDDTWARMLEQFHVPWRPGFTWDHETRCWDNAPWGSRPNVLRQFVEVFVRQCQELYDALIELHRLRTVYDAIGENLDTLGRIVGTDRGRPLLDYSEWFRGDDSRTVDKSPTWVPGAPTMVLHQRTDEEFRHFIITKAIRNHTFAASVPEIQAMVKMLIGLDVSFVRTAPMTVIVIASGANFQHKYILGIPESNDRYENFWVPPYPAGLSIAGVVTK